MCEMPDLAARVEELRADREHGASWMARRTVEALLAVAEEPAESCEDLLDRLVGAARQLAESRPRMGAISGAAGRVLAAANPWRHLDVDELRRLIREEGAGILDSRVRAAASIAIQLCERTKGAVVVTHSASATVREALIHDSPAKVYCTVSEPIGEGRAFSDDLRAEGLDVELIDDEKAAEALSGASLLLVGADTVFRDGTLCNKVGTTALAQAAAKLEVPTVVACEVVKLAPIDASEAPEAGPGERDLFELTPPELITEFATEEGVFRPEEIPHLVDRTPFLLEGYSLLYAATTA
jgi:translation initiation factor 2B subunit (eIF-2B alpha/beta/delta family)